MRNLHIGWPTWHRLPRRRQQDRTDCGAACLAAVAEYYGLRMPIARVRQHAATDARGTTVLGLVEAAEKLGFAARGVKAARANLDALPTPAIAHVVVDGVLAHFVVVYRIGRRSVVTMDPRDGRVRSVPRETFGDAWTGVMVILVPAERFQPVDSRLAPTVRFWRLVRPHRSVMLQALLGAALYTVLGLSTAVYVQKIVDHVLPEGNRNLLNLLGVLMVVLVATQLLVGVLKDVFTLRTGQRIDTALILGYYRHVLRLPQRFFDSMRVGEIIARVNDAVKIRAFINDVALDLAVNVFVVASALALMFAYSWRLGGLMAAMLPLYALVYGVANGANRKVQRRLMESGADLESQLVESVSAAATVKRFGLEAFTAERMERRFVRVLRNVHASALTAMGGRASAELLSKVGVVVLLWVGGRMVIDRQISAGELMSIYALAGYLAGPATALVQANRTLQEALIAADRLFEILDLEMEPASGRIPLATGAPLGDIRFERVTFRYGGRGAVFTDLDLTIPEGTLTALVGESGSGKTTLAALIQGVYQPSGGRVRIGAHDLRHLAPGSVRDAIATVPQQIHLFAGTVLENIAIGDRQPDVGRVLAISEELGIDRFVESMPEGYRTLLGERGANLSGGQQQRIAIARALYRRPRILVLDEATSSLDSESEAYVHRTLERLRTEGCTVIVIAHRFATIRGADRIVVLEEGRVAEVGMHAQLLRAGGPYARLWRRQTLGVSVSDLEIAGIAG